MSQLKQSAKPFALRPVRPRPSPHSLVERPVEVLAGHGMRPMARRRRRPGLPKLQSAGVGAAGLNVRRRPMENGPLNTALYNGAVRSPTAIRGTAVVAVAVVGVPACGQEGTALAANSRPCVSWPRTLSETRSVGPSFAAVIASAVTAFRSAVATRRPSWATIRSSY